MTKTEPLKYALFSQIAEFKAAESGPKINNAVKAVEDYLGGEGKIIRNADGDTILMRGDKKIRFDVGDPTAMILIFTLNSKHRAGSGKTLVQSTGIIFRGMDYEMAC